MDSRNQLLAKIRMLQTTCVTNEETITKSNETIMDQEDGLDAARGRVEGYHIEVTHNKERICRLQEHINHLNDTIALLHKTAIKV
jgi:predicted  nucleic acid-binding Zn-ribbon protein